MSLLKKGEGRKSCKGQYVQDGTSLGTAVAITSHSNIQKQRYVQKLKWNNVQFTADMLGLGFLPLSPPHPLVISAR